MLITIRQLIMNQNEKILSLFEYIDNTDIDIVF